MVSGFEGLTTAIGDLPLLWHSTEWVAGFHNIVDRVREIRISNQWSSGLDNSAPPDNADVIAYVGPVGPNPACHISSG